MMAASLARTRASDRDRMAGAPYPVDQDEPVPLVACHHAPFASWLVELIPRPRRLRALGDLLDDRPVFPPGAAEVFGHGDGEDVAFGAHVGAGIPTVCLRDGEHFACGREACRDLVRFGGHALIPRGASVR